MIKNKNKNNTVNHYFFAIILINRDLNVTPLPSSIDIVLEQKKAVQPEEQVEVDKTLQNSFQMI